MSELKPSQRRDFLQFTTGSPKLPIGGMSKAPNPPTFVLAADPHLRIQILDTDVHGGLQAERASVYLGRLPSKCNDLRELPQAA